MDRSWKVFDTTSCHCCGQGKGTHFQGKEAPSNQENTEGELTGTVYFHELCSEHFCM